MGSGGEEKVGASHLHDSCRFLIYMLLNRALDRALAIELDFTNTNGAKEEDTMCPVCHESMQAPLPIFLFPLNPPMRSLRRQ